METVYIYGLVDPRNNKLKYVGKSKSPVDRFSAHILEAKKGIKSYKNNWIKGLLNYDFLPLLIILDETDEEKANLLEKYWIKKSKEEGCTLVNMTDGGDGGPTFQGRKHTKETIEKMSAVKVGHIGWNKGLKGYKLPEGTGLKISQKLKGKVSAFKGRKHSEETKQRISNSLKGKIESNETKKKKSESHKGKSLSVDTKKKIGLAHKNKTVSLETRKKISDYNKGKIISEETKLKISTSNKGKHQSEQTKRKISETHKKNMSEERIDRLRQINKGRKPSDETKRKISLSLMGKNKGKLKGPMKQETKDKISITKKMKYRHNFNEDK